MILVKKNIILDFASFGIDIPLSDRHKMIWQYLRANYSDTVFYSNDGGESQLTKEDLLLAHTAEYVDKLMDGNDLAEVMIQCFELNTYGKNHDYKSFIKLRDLILNEAFYTYYGMKLALKHGVCFFLGGGMHHAMSFAGRGFCLVNDIVIGARKLMLESLIKKVWIIDIDAHKGDGTSELTFKDSRFITMSIHMQDGWPLNGRNDGDPELIPSTVDVPIGFHQEHLYLEKLSQGLKMLCEKSGDRPDLAIVVDGADPWECDELPGSIGIRLTKQQMLKRDQMVYYFLKEKNIPMLFVMGGGYGKKSGEIYIQFLDWLLTRSKN